jgi:hypothetical protein
MKIPRFYVDTSVIGCCFDDEFAEASNRLIELASFGACTLVVSDTVIRELESAPENVRNLLASLPESCVERVAEDNEIYDLRDAYLGAHILGERWLDDLTHVATATVYRADAIVSWNFKHIVRFDKMKAYNQVNLFNGYDILTIISPMEVMADDDD